MLGLRVKDPQLFLKWSQLNPNSRSQMALQNHSYPLQKIQGVRREQTPATSATLETAMSLGLDIMTLRSPPQVQGLESGPGRRPYLPEANSDFLTATQKQLTSSLRITETFPVINLL